MGSPWSASRTLAGGGVIGEGLIGLVVATVRTGSVDEQAASINNAPKDAYTGVPDRTHMRVRWVPHSLAKSPMSPPTYPQPTYRPPIKAGMGPK